MTITSFTSRKPLFILASGLSLILVLVVLFSALSVSQINRLNQVTQDFYDHPFTVSNAAAELRSDIGQMRIRMLQIAHSSNLQATNRLIDEVSINHADSKRQLSVIFKGFLGDMSRVEEIRTILDEWSSLRAEIIQLASTGKNEQAMQLASTRGAAIYERLYSHISYVSDYAHNKAMAFERESQIESRFMINNLYWIMAMLIALISLTGAYMFRLIYLHNLKLEQDAYIDSLTGLLNRQQFYVLSDQALKHVQRYQDGLSLLILDIDHFKQINDRYGHNTGDAVLRELSAVLVDSLRNSDVICRWGGEEFVVLMPGLQRNTALFIANRINQCFAENTVTIEQQKVNATISIGVTDYAGQTSIEEMVNEADQALYQAKNSGRNRVIVYQSDAAKRLRPEMAASQ